MLGGGYAPPSRDAPWLRRTVVPSHCRSDVPTFSVARAEDDRAKAQDRERKPSTTELKLKTGERNQPMFSGAKRKTTGLKPKTEN